MATDARFSTNLASHPKVKKLRRRLGADGCWAWVCLVLWVAADRSDGDLAGLDDEDIELSADWRGEPGAFVRELVNLRMLDGDELDRSVHDWAEHNPWAAGSEARSLKGRWNAIKKHHGEAEADRQVPEYAAIRHANSKHPASAQDASSTGVAGDVHAPATAPTPAPYPTPSPSPSPSPSTSGSVAPAAAEPPSIPEPPGSSLPTMAGAVAITLRAKGIATVNSSSPDLLALLEGGVDIGVFAAAADKALKAKKPSFAYVLGIVKSQIEESQRLAANARASPGKSGSHAGFDSKDYHAGANADGSF